MTEVTASTGDAPGGDPPGKGALASLFLVVFIDLLGFGIVIPQLQFYADDFGASPSTIGWLMAVYSLMQFLFAPLWGHWSDRVGRRLILIVCILGGAGSYILFGLARTVVWLFAARIAGGIMAGNISVAQAYIADVTTPQDRARGMGLIGAAFGLGFVLGPALGGLLGHWGGNLAIGLFTAGLCLLNALLVVRLLKEPPGVDRSRPQVGHPLRLQNIRRALRATRVALLVLLSFLSVFAFASLEATFILYSKHQFGFNELAAGLAFAYVGVIAALMQGVLIGPLSRWLGEKALLLAGLVLLVIGYVWLPFVRPWSGLLGALGVMAAGRGLSDPSLSSLVSFYAPAGQRGVVFGVMRSLGSLARVVGPVWGGWAYERFFPAAPFWTGALALAAASLLALVVLVSELTSGRRGAADGP